MKLGIDFNQFNHFQLNRFFRTLGFSKVFDQFDVLDADNLVNPTSRKRAVLRMIQRVDPLKRIALTLSPGTLFICMK
jgi:hypothetical protein